MRLYRRRDSRMVTATELACFEYFKEQWRLQYALGLEPGNRAALDAGTRHHEGKAVAESIAGGSISVGRLLIAVATRNGMKRPVKLTRKLVQWHRAVDREPSFVCQILEFGDLDD